MNNPYITPVDTRPDTDLDWQSRSLCREVDLDLFFPEKDAQRGHHAKVICRRCPVQTECLEYALEHAPEYGIWGGTAPKDRDRIKRERRQDVA